ARGLDALGAPRNPELRAAWQRARDVSRALAAWDRFDHAGALEILGNYEGVVAQALPAHFIALRSLADPAKQAHTPLRLWDLWLNAQRRAADGRYDDAVARIYRLIEWTAQWQLASKLGWQTADLPREVAEAAGIVPNRDGKYQAGLYAAWQLAAEHCGGELAGFFARERQALLDHLRRRNDSILAHGTVPVSAPDWQAWAAWLNAEFEPLLRALLAEARIHAPFPQLPDVYPWAAELAA
ncbi:MAG: TIGR02710 family CRISPR-associated CARF protein, partial [Burkholderiales bacterium]|nr:TIGR02710 family CRISPR-associated CARF protein [Burkholderiales bacterium]